MRPQTSSRSSGGNTYRLWLLGEELIISLVHGGKVVHLGQEDVHLDNIVDAAAGLVEDSREVLEGLTLILS